MSLNSAEQKHLLGMGRVPSLRRRHVPRRQVSDQLFLRLKNVLTDSDSGWLLVCGMVGSGKSELVTELLWERPELCFVLVDRVLWVADRRFHSTELEHLATDTLLLASLLCATDVSEIANCDGLGLVAIAQRLNDLLNDTIAKTLLVLDGVQMVETVQFFDKIKGPKCKILATSSSRTLFESLEGLQTFAMPSDGCTNEELTHMARNYGIKETFLSERINSILCRTGGNFALLEKMFTLARGSSEIFDSLLAQLLHGPLSSVGCHSAYYNFSLEKSLELCFERLGQSLIRSFDYCTFIEPFQWTSFEIYFLIWPLDVCGSESEATLRATVGVQLDTLEANSLLDKSAEGADDDPNNFSAFRYRLQPMVHNFLLHSRPNSMATFNTVQKMISLKLRNRSSSLSDRRQITAYLTKNEHSLAIVQKHLDQRIYQRCIEDKSRSGVWSFGGINSADGGDRGLIRSTTEMIGRPSAKSSFALERLQTGPFFADSVFIITSWSAHERVPAGLRPAKAVNEQRAGGEHQNEPITFSTTILQPNDAKNSSRPLIFHKNVKTGRKNDGAFGIAFAINATEGTPTKARVTIPPPAGKDFGVNTILQTNLVDSRGRVLKGVSAVQLPVPDIRNSKDSRASASQVEAEENAIPIKFSG
uniref:NB-ARC domain-containing protein n=1 Tax=Globodera rostochiensis TaxID=31243 RepID=A0A914HWG7_GLORO